MNTYFIECEHNVYIDSYEEGETKNVNNYDTKGMYKTETPLKAIEKHLYTLGYCFNPEYMQQDEEEEENNKIWYSVLVDEENSAATENEKKIWQKNELVLYSNNLTIYVFEVIPAKI